MGFDDLLRFAFQGIGRQRLRSTLTTLAMAIGVALVGTMLALTSGLRSLFASEFMSGNQMRQIVVTRMGGLSYTDALFSNTSDIGTKLTDDLAQTIRQINGVQKLTPVIVPYVFDSMNYGKISYVMPAIRAYEPNGTINYRVAAGRGLRASDGVGVVTVTPKIADELGFHGRYGALVGQRIDLRTHSGYSGPGSVLPPLGPRGAVVEPAATNLSATVVGVVDSPDTEKALYLPITWGRQLVQSSRWQGLTRVYMSELDRVGYQSFVLMAHSDGDVDRVTAAVRHLGVGAVSAASYVQRQVSVATIASWILGSIGVVALVIAGLGIVNTMSMAVIERTREIGIMRAIGASRHVIRSVFVAEAATFGALGGLAGLATTYVVARGINWVLDQQLAANSMQARGIVDLPLPVAAAVLLGTVGLSMIAGLYPAWRAAQLEPASAIRFE